MGPQGKGGPKFDKPLTSLPHDNTRPRIHPAKPLLYSLPRDSLCAQAAPQDYTQSTSSIFGPAPDEASPPMSGMPPPGIPPMPPGMPPPPPPPCWYILLMMGLQVPSSSLSLCSSSSTCTGAEGRQEQAGQSPGVMPACAKSSKQQAAKVTQACHSCMPQHNALCVEVLSQSTTQNEARQPQREQQAG